MTKLDSAQRGLLEEIQGAKAHFDKWEAGTQAEVAVLRNQAKEPLRKLVARAMEAKIPVRQIHLNGLGFGQVGQMTNFLDTAAKGSARESLLGLLSDTPVAGLATGLNPAGSQYPAITQSNYTASWIDPVTEKKRSISRMLTTTFAFIDDEPWERLTEGERAMFLADNPRTIVGQAEYAAFEKDGTEPERWAE